SKELLLSNPNIDIILYGEGEHTLYEILQEKPLATIKGIVYRENGCIVSTPTPDPISMDEIPFPYEDITKIHDKIFYYETSRGCPFRCSYCLSSTTNGVRYRSLSNVFQHLTIFLNANVRQVKFVDRTFNAKKTHYLPILNFIKEHDNGITNFHFEIAEVLLY
ncbi:MAG: B12-binding domain-containing radical SAM protein, partial [Oscillospiraceae bacterium]